MSVVDTGTTDTSSKLTYDAEFETADADGQDLPDEAEGYPCYWTYETMTSC